MLPTGNARQEEEAERSGGASKLHHGGLLGLATVSMAINLAACTPPLAPELYKNGYFLALSVVFLAGVANVFVAVSDSDDPRGRAGCRAGGAARSKLKYASVVVAPFVVAAALSVLYATSTPSLH
ncbi:unnamed protein product [Urochloa decumbens]|uniref:Uncharacterized protein n=1 Tax=Urochloa decumbens TaxID=240449 RepID=A0ABC8Z9R5_9POAL